MSNDIEPEQPPRSPSGFLVREFAHLEVRRGAPGDRCDPDGADAHQRRSVRRVSAADSRASPESPSVERDAESGSKPHGSTFLAKVATSWQPIAAFDEDRRAAAAPESYASTSPKHGGDAEQAYESGVSDTILAATPSSTRPQGPGQSDMYSWAVGSGAEATAPRRGLSGDEEWRTELKALNERMGVLIQSQMRIEMAVCDQREAQTPRVAPPAPPLASRFASIGAVGPGVRTTSLAVPAQGLAQGANARANRIRSVEFTGGPNRDVESPGVMTPKPSTPRSFDDIRGVADAVTVKAGGRYAKHRRGGSTSSVFFEKEESNGSADVASLPLRPVGNVANFDLTQSVQEVTLRDQNNFRTDNSDQGVVSIREEIDREHAADQTTETTIGAAVVGSAELKEVSQRGSDGKVARHSRRRSSGPSGRFRVDVQESETRSRLQLGSSFGTEAVGHIVNRAARGWNTVVDCLRNIALNPKYEYTLAVAILVSVVFVGLETQRMTEGVASEKDMFFDVANVTFDTVFAVDVLFKGFVHGRNYFTNADWRWNILDATFVFACIIADLIEVFVDLNSAGRAFRAIRLVRLIRTVRVARAVRSIREFQKMAYALMSSTRTLMCSLLILFFVMYFFGILFCQAVADFKASDTATPQLVEPLVYWYGSLVTSFTTLFMVITGGVSWQLAYEPLFALSRVYSAIFMLYMAIVLFGVMNVVTSVFVESAVMSAQHYKDLIIQEKESQREIAMSHMKQVFKQIDDDGSGFVNGEEMEAFLQDPSLRQYVNALDINAEDARMLFRLLDKDGSQRVDIDEFCEGCIRLQGDAKSFDVHAMIFQIQLFLGKWGDFTMFVEERFGRLDAILGHEDEEYEDESNETDSKPFYRRSLVAPSFARLSGRKSTTVSA